QHSVSLSLMLRPHPRPPLFPYTTLFRSPRTTAHVHPTPARAGHPLPRPAPLGFLPCTPPLYPRATPTRSPRRRPALSFPAANARDRKSTRLNSSHVKISYAVFCLKKKTH